MVTPTVIQEFLMGVKTVSDFREYNIHFSRLNLCNDDWQYTSIMAARLYFDLRKKGITIRKSTDCLIAQVAIQNDVLLVHSDSDFELIAKGSELKTFS
jgi:predicted nucleic acid-binding protein